MNFLMSTNLYLFVILGNSKVKSDVSRQAKELKVNILRAKSMSLDDSIGKEVELEKKITHVSISHFSNDLKTDELKENIKTCMILMKRFYDRAKSSSEALNVAKLWAEIQESLRSVPNIFIFQAMIKELDWSNSSLQQLNLSFANKDGLSSLEKQLTFKLHQHLIVSGIESHSQASRLEEVKSSCSNIIEVAKNELDGIVNSGVELSFAYDDEEELVADYVGVMLKHLVLRGKCEHLVRIADEMKSQSKEEEKAISDYATVIQSTQNIYNLTDDKIQTAQHSIAQMFQINQKLNLGKISMIHLIQELKASSKYQGINRTMLNITQAKDGEVPLHYAELQTFLELSIEKFNSASDIVAFELKGDSKLALDDATALLMKQVIGDGSTMKNLIESMKRNIKISKEILSIPIKVETSSYNPPEISMSKLEEKLRANREAIMELLDNIAKTNVSCRSLLRDHDRVFRAALSNSYKNFIPASMKFEGKSFKSHDNEFNLYFRMIQD